MKEQASSRFLVQLLDRRDTRFWVLIIALALVISSLTVLSAELSLRADADEGQSDFSLEAPDEASARLTALRRKARVEVVAARDATSTTWIEKDGTTATTEVYAAVRPPVDRSISTENLSSSERTGPSNGRS